MLEDMMLIWKFKRGSPDALQAIYEKYCQTMLTVATALCHDVHTAEDVVQDCIVSFARIGRDLKLKGSLQAYLTASVVNRIRDQWRADKHRPQPLDQTADALHSKEDGPETSAICNEQMRRIGSALIQLPLEERQAVVLYTRGRITYKEIAKVQGVSIPTVQRRYRCGLEKLRVILNGEVKS